MMKNLKNGPITVFAKYKCLDALNAMQKNPAPYKVRFLKKSRKTSKILQLFFFVLAKNGIF